MNSKDVLEDVTGQLRDCAIGAPLRDVVPTHFTFRIESFSLLSKNSIEKYESYAFEVQGYKWNLSIYPNGNKNEKGEDHISLYLGIANKSSLPPACEINASFRFFVFDQIRDKYLILGDMGGITRRFHQMKTEWGFPKLLSLTTFQDASNGYLVNDTCVFGVEILVCKNEGCGEILSMIENSITQNHLWTIERFSQLKNEYLYSEVFSAGDHKWKIMLYPKGDGVEKNKSLSMYLKLANSGTCSTKVYASYKLRLINQFVGNHLTCKGERWFISNDLGWGSLKFIELNELNDQTKGFLVKDTVIGILVKDTCIVEAEVTVLGVVKKLPIKST